MAQQDTQPRRAESNVTRERIEYYSSVNPVVMASKTQDSESLTLSVTVAATPFDIRYCDFSKDFNTDGTAVGKRLNWGKAILYNYVGFKLEEASAEGRYGAESDVTWRDITADSGLAGSLASSEGLSGVPVLCSNYISTVARHNSMSVSTYLSGGSIPQCYNYAHAINLNRYMHAGYKQFDADADIAALRAGDADAKRTLSVYADSSSAIKNVVFTMSATMKHSLSAGVKSYRLTVQNPGTVVSPTVVYIYHEGNGEYYTYVEGSAVQPQSGSEVEITHVPVNTGANRISIAVSADGAFQKTVAALRFKMKANPVDNSSFRRGN